MSDHDRGMKKWAPYASLIEQKDYLYRMRKNRDRISKPLLSSEQAQEINDLLLNHHGDLFVFRYFHDGYIYEVEQKILSVDCVARMVFGSELALPLKAIVGLKRID